MAARQEPRKAIVLAVKGSPIPLTLEQLFDMFCSPLGLPICSPLLAPGMPSSDDCASSGVPSSCSDCSTSSSTFRLLVSVRLWLLSVLLWLRLSRLWG